MENAITPHELWKYFTTAIVKGLFNIPAPKEYASYRTCFKRYLFVSEKDIRLSQSIAISRDTFSTRNFFESLGNTSVVISQVLE